MLRNTAGLVPVYRWKIAAKWLARVREYWQVPAAGSGTPRRLADLRTFAVPSALLRCIAPLG